MKPRKVILTIEMLTDIPLKQFNQRSITGIFEGWLEGWIDEILEIHQVRAQVVKGDK